MNAKTQGLLNQISRVMSLDALVVLGGERSDRSRTNHALCLYNSVNRRGTLPVLLTGYDSGFRPGLLARPEAEEMKGHLEHMGVPTTDLITEPQGRDTLANMTLSRPLLRGLDAKKVGIVTDGYHMARGVWTAQRVWGPSIDVSPLPTTKQTSYFGMLTERFVLQAQRYDLWRVGLEPGDQEGFERYLREQHPFHAPLYGNKPSFGAYQLGIYALNLLR